MAHTMAHAHETKEPNAYPTSATTFRQHSAHPPAQDPSQHPVPHPSYAHPPPIALCNGHSQTQLGTRFERPTVSMPISAGILPQSQDPSQHPVPHPSCAHLPPIALTDGHSQTQLGTRFERPTAAMPFSAGILPQSQHMYQTPHILPQTFPQSHIIRNQALFARQPSSALPMNPGRMFVPVHQTQINTHFTFGNPRPLNPGQQTHPWLGHREWGGENYPDGLDIIFGYIKVSPNSKIS